MSFIKGKSQKMKKSTKVFKVSDPSKNVYGFAVATAGIQTQNFLLNPVMLLNHNYDKMMGLWADLSIVGENMTAIPVFDEIDPEAINMSSKVEQDILKGASIGIIPLSVKDGVITKSDLLEISLTPVPANRSALVLYNTKGVALSIEEAKTYCLSIQDTKSDHKKPFKMNEKFKLALLALAVQTGLTIKLSADATDEDGVLEIEKVAKHIAGLNLSVQVLTATNDANKAAAAELLKTESETYVDGKIALKVITADKRADFIKLYIENTSMCKSILDAVTPVVLTAVPGAAAAAAKEVAGREEWTFEKWFKEDGLGLSAMEIADPEKFQTLFNAYTVSLKANGATA